MAEVENKEGCVVFYMASGVITGDPVEDKMLRSHEAEARRRRARFCNYGWGLAENGICSKTSMGKLSTCIDPKTMQVSHEWFD